MRVRARVCTIWPQPTDIQRQKIEQAAKAILDARDLYPDATFADMYGNLLLFPELMKAHRANDAAVLEAYGFPKDATESDIVARLFKMYQELCLYRLSDCKPKSGQINQKD